jgi:hypothetical protein
VNVRANAIQARARLLHIQHACHRHLCVGIALPTSSHSFSRPRRVPPCRVPSSLSLPSSLDFLYSHVHIIPLIALSHLIRTPPHARQNNLSDLPTCLYAETVSIHPLFPRVQTLSAHRQKLMHEMSERNSLLLGTSIVYCGSLSAFLPSLNYQ